MLTTLPWTQVSSGASGSGLKYKTYHDSALQKPRPQGLDSSIVISAVRASRKARLFGAFHDGVYYVIWFDRNHTIVPD